MSFVLEGRQKGSRFTDLHDALENCKTDELKNFAGHDGPLRRPVNGLHGLAGLTNDPDTPMYCSPAVMVTLGKIKCFLKSEKGRKLAPLVSQLANLNEDEKAPKRTSIEVNEMIRSIKEAVWLMEPLRTQWHISPRLSNE